MGAGAAGPCEALFSTLFEPLEEPYSFVPTVRELSQQSTLTVNDFDSGVDSET